MKEIFVVIGGVDDDIQKVIKQYHKKVDIEDCVFVGVDGGCRKLIAAGYPIDFAIGDFDSVDEAELTMIKKYAKEIRTLPCEKDETDFETSLIWCAEQFSKHKLYVLGAFGGRIDHELSIMWVVHQPKFKKIVPYLQFESLMNHVSFLLPGCHQIDKSPNMNYLSFITMTKVTNLSLTEVKYPLENISYNAPVALISNEFLTETMTISFEDGLIMTCQTND